MYDAPRSPNELALDRTQMGFGRTVMALERTLMAWIRTSLSLISFGFTIYKFLEAMQRTAGSTMRENAPRNLGIFLILLGMGALLLAIFQFRGAMAKIQSFSEIKPKFSISILTAIGVLIAGLFTLLNIFFGLGSF